MPLKDWFCYVKSKQCQFGALKIFAPGDRSEKSSGPPAPLSGSWLEVPVINYYYYLSLIKWQRLPSFWWFAWWSASWGFWVTCYLCQSITWIHGYSIFHMVIPLFLTHRTTFLTNWYFFMDIFACLPVSYCKTIYRLQSFHFCCSVLLLGHSLVSSCCK